MCFGQWFTMPMKVFRKQSLQFLNNDKIYQIFNQLSLNILNLKENSKKTFLHKFNKLISLISHA